jgi:hypothetical protein
LEEQARSGEHRPAVQDGGWRRQPVGLSRCLTTPYDSVADALRLGIAAWLFSGTIGGSAVRSVDIDIGRRAHSINRKNKYDTAASWLHSRIDGRKQRRYYADAKGSVRRSTVRSQEYQNLRSAATSVFVQAHLVVKYGLLDGTAPFANHALNLSLK